MGEAFELLLGEVGLPCDVYPSDTFGGCGVGAQQQQWPVRGRGLWRVCRVQRGTGSCLGGGKARQGGQGSAGKEREMT